MVDFGALYYGARCVMHHHDPFDPDLMLQEFEADSGRFGSGTAGEGEDRIVITRTDNLPTTLYLAIPFALVPWQLAQNLWMILTCALFITAATLVWDLGGGETQILWAALAGFMIAESDMLFLGGNVAGIAVSLCVIAVWCFLKDRHVLVGVVLLAVSLLLKPHDSGFVWLYFLLAGGALRKRALQTLAIIAILAACAALWIQPTSPHWLSEMHRNLGFLLAHGGASDPGPHGMSANTSAQIIDLQAAFSAIKDNPRFYNPVAYLISGLTIFAWILGTLWKRRDEHGTRLAIAAISALSLLPIYHRINDAIILLLALPACAMLWKEAGPKRWFAIGLTSLGILLTATMPLAFLSEHAPAIGSLAARLPGKWASVLLLHPTPVVLLAMGCFYLWLYLRHAPAHAEEPAAATTATAILG